MAKDKSEGRTRRSPADSEGGDAASAEGAAASEVVASPKAPARRGAKAGASAGARGGRRAAVEPERSRDEDDDASDEDSSDEREDRDENDDPEGDGDVIEVAGEIVDEESVDPDGAKVVDGKLRTEKPDRDEGAALSRTDPLQAYLREVQRHKLLTPDEEKDLTTKFATTQDARIAARLVTANLRLVVKLAYEYRRAYKNIMDLIQEGNIGLMQAVKRYDPYRGVKLSSYAAWWIRAYILRFILNNWRLVKLGTTQAQRKLFFNLNKEKAKLSALGIEPEAAEIAKRLGVEEKEVIDMDRRLSSGEASLDAPVGDSDGRAVSRLDMMPSGGSGPDMAFEQEEMDKLLRERLLEFRKTLKGKDIEIFDKRVYIPHNTEDPAAQAEPLTLQELGDQFGISRERVRQLEARLTHKLRQYLRQELGDAVDAS
ncbi:MAG: RNA polymerase factor sigma-32 [Polyangiaceae bacterium]